MLAKNNDNDQMRLSESAEVTPIKTVPAFGHLANCRRCVTILSVLNMARVYNAYIQVGALTAHPSPCLHLSYSRCITILSVLSLLYYEYIYIPGTLTSGWVVGRRRMAAADAGTEDKAADAGFLLFQDDRKQCCYCLDCWLQMCCCLNSNTRMHPAIGYFTFACRVAVAGRARLHFSAWM